jgi:hypothetical protein
MLGLHHGDTLTAFSNINLYRFSTHVDFSAVSTTLLINEVVAIFNLLFLSLQPTSERVLGATRLAFRGILEFKAYHPTATSQNRISVHFNS